MFLLSIKLDRVSFETKGRQNLQKTADFLIESIVFCPLVPPSWISLVDPTSAMYASEIYVSYIYDPGTANSSFPVPLLDVTGCVLQYYTDQWGLARLRRYVKKSGRQALGSRLFIQTAPCLNYFKIPPGKL